jgi:hypothetical protein
MYDFYECFKCEFVCFLLCLLGSSNGNDVFCSFVLRKICCNNVDE